MEYETREIKEGIKLHYLHTDKYKTDLIYLALMIPSKREYITHNALLPLVLKRGTMNYHTQYDLSKALDNLYGACLSATIDKKGDNLVNKFSLDLLDNRYALDDTNIIKGGLDIMFDIVFNPLLENGMFKSDFLEAEKEHLKYNIASKIDDKESYATEACVSAMFGEEGYGLYKGGYLEDVDSINPENMTKFYNYLVDNAEIDIFVSSKTGIEEFEKYIRENETIQRLSPRKGEFIEYDTVENARPILDTPKVITENMDIVQGKLVIGYDVRPKEKEFQELGLVYNALLGSAATSLLFQNVREKEGLCYSTRSIFLRSKLALFIKCGIQVENYEKVLKLVDEQLDILRNGEFSDEDLSNAKQYIIALIKAVKEDQDAELAYYLGCELAKNYLSLDEYIDRVEKITREDVISIAGTVFVNTIYFLKSLE